MDLEFPCLLDKGERLPSRPPGTTSWPGPALSHWCAALGRHRDGESPALRKYAAHSVDGQLLRLTRRRPSRCHVGRVREGEGNLLPRGADQLDLDRGAGEGDGGNAVGGDRHPLGRLAHEGPAVGEYGARVEQLKVGAVVGSELDARF